MGHGKLSAVDVPCGVSHIRNEQEVPSVSGTRTPPSDWWDTDFSDDDDDGISKVSNLNRKPTFRYHQKTAFRWSL